MMKGLRIGIGSGALLLIARGLAGEMGPAATPGITLEVDKPAKRNQVELGYWMGLNVAVDFKNLGGYPAQTDTGPESGGGVNRFYDDGTSMVDSSGNAGGMTWYYSYSGSDQIMANGDLVMSSRSSTQHSIEKDVDDGIAHGLELNYRRDIGELWKGRWGVEGGFGFIRYSMDDNSVHTTSVTQLTDTFEALGVVPPLGPYEGSYEGPGPLIADAPQRVVTTATTETTTITGMREYDADLYAFRIGPYWELPLHERVSVGLSGGFAFAVVDSEFRYRETVTINGLPPVSRSGSSSDTDVLVGSFLRGSCSYHFNDSWMTTLGAEWIYLGDYEQDAQDKEAVADFDDSIFLSLSLGYKF